MLTPLPYFSCHGDSWEESKLEQDKNGDYFVDVEMEGGIFLQVELDKKRVHRRGRILRFGKLHRGICSGRRDGRLLKRYFSLAKRDHFPYNGDIRSTAALPAHNKSETEGV